MKKSEFVKGAFVKHPSNGNGQIWKHMTTPSGSTFHTNELKNDTLNTSGKSRKRNLEEKQETSEKRTRVLPYIRSNEVMDSDSSNKVEKEVEATNDYLKRQECNLAEQERQNKNAKEQERRQERRLYLDMLKDENPLVGLCPKRPDDNTTLRLTEAYIEQRNFRCSLHHSKAGEDNSRAGRALSILQRKHRMFGIALVQPRIQSENRRVKVASILDVTEEVEEHLRRNRIDMLCEDFFTYVHNADHQYVEAVLTQAFIACRGVPFLPFRCRMLKGSLTSSSGKITPCEGSDPALVEICGETRQQNKHGRILCATVKLVEEASLNRITLHEALRENYYRTRHRYDDLKQSSTILDVSHSISHITGWLPGQVKLKNALEYICDTDRHIAMAAIIMLLRHRSYKVVYRLRIPGSGTGNRLISMMSEGYTVDEETFMCINTPIDEKTFQQEYLSQQVSLQEFQQQIASMTKSQKDVNGVCRPSPCEPMPMLLNDSGNSMIPALPSPSLLQPQHYLQRAQGPSQMVYHAPSMVTQAYLNPYFTAPLVTYRQNEGLSTDVSTFGQTYHQL